MEASRMNQLLEGWEVLSRQEGGLRIYVNPEEQWRDEGSYRVLRIGHPNDLPTRCVLLLGETGAGKTTFVNAALNCLFGVKVNDPFRLQVKEETEGGRQATESQTDAITVYVIQHQAGMEHGYNCVLIDTPGLADTRGKQRQEAVRSGFETFLTTEDAGVDELHCVGIVAKANVNRDVHFHRQMTEEIISLFGNSVPDVTCLLATFATDEPSVGAVMKNAGIRYTRVFPLDNGVLYTPVVNADTSHAARLLPIKWEIMREHCDAFFGYLVNAPSVSTAVLRERKLFDMNKKKLRTQIKEAATLMAAYHRDKGTYNKYELQEATNRDYMEQVRIVIISLEDPAGDLRAHNCRKCRKTCHPCIGSVEEKAFLDTLCNAEAEAARLKHGLILVERKNVKGSDALLVFTAAAATDAEAACIEANATGAAVKAAETGGSAVALKASPKTGGFAVALHAGDFEVALEAAARPSDSVAAPEVAAGTGGSKPYSIGASLTCVSTTFSAKGTFTNGSKTDIKATIATAAIGVAGVGTLAKTTSITGAGTGGVAVSKAAAATTAAVAAPEAAAATTAVVAAPEAAAATNVAVAASKGTAAISAAAATATDAASAAGTIAASEAAAGTNAVGIAAAASTAALIIGGVVVGVGLGVGGIHVYEKLKNSCKMNAKNGCTLEGCRHSLSDHVRQDKMIKRVTKDDQRTNKEKKERYDEAVAGKSEAKGRITRDKQGILSKMTTVSQITEDLLYHAKRTQELTSVTSDYVTEVMNHIISDSMQAGQDVTPHAVQLASVVRQAMEQLASCPAQQVLGSNTLVEEMLLGMFRDQ